MAEFLVKAVYPDGSMTAAKQAAGVQYGDIIIVYPNGSMKDGIVNPRCRCVGVRVPGIPYEEVIKYMQPELDEHGLSIMRRRYRFRLEDMPKATVDELAEKNLVTLDKAIAETFLRDKVLDQDVSVLIIG